MFVGTPARSRATIRRAAAKSGLAAATSSWKAL
jgi:hypothetical protein